MKVEEIDGLNMVTYEESDFPSDFFSWSKEQQIEFRQKLIRDYEASKQGHNSKKPHKKHKW